MHLSIDEIETLIAFIKTHKRNEIPDDVWDLYMKMCDAKTMQNRRVIIIGNGLAMYVNTNKDCKTM